MSKRLGRAGGLAMAAGLLTLLALMSGCTGRVVRTITVETVPPGALVSLNDNQVGRTPLKTQFTHYGTYHVRIEQSGYETLTLLEPVRAPWYQWPFIDLAFETIIPGTRHDEHHFGPYELKPATTSDPESLLERARALREEAQLPPAEIAAEEPAATDTGEPATDQPAE